MDWMSSCAYLSMPFFCGTQLETTPRCDDLFAGTAGKGLGYAHVCRYTVRINSSTTVDSVDQCFCFSVHWLPDRDYSNCHRSEQYIAAWVGLKVNMAHFEFRIPIS